MFVTLIKTDGMLAAHTQTFFLSHVYLLLLRSELGVIVLYQLIQNRQYIQSQVVFCVALYLNKMTSSAILNLPRN